MIEAAAIAAGGGGGVLVVVVVVLFHHLWLPQDVFVDVANSSLGFRGGGAGMITTPQCEHTPRSGLRFLANPSHPQLAF